MAEEADVFIKNRIGEQITVTRTYQGGSTPTPIADENEEGFLKLVPEQSLVIEIPKERDMNENPLIITTRITDLRVSCSTDATVNRWVITIFPNDLPPEVPTTVNITAGGVGE